MDKFEEHEMKKIRQIIRKLLDQSINSNVIGKKPKRIRYKLKDKIINDIWTVIKTKTKERKKKKYNGRINKDRIIRDIRTLF